ncbi:MAG: efflux RND transporter periplasmic adaptor subunit [Planctomycetota bacterium]
MADSAPNDVSHEQPEAKPAKKGASGSRTPVVVTSALLGAVGAAVIVVAIFVFVIGVGGPPAGGPGGQGGPGGGMGGPPPALVELGAAKLEGVRRRVEVTGRLAAVRRAVVASEVEGKVLGVGVEVGASVVGGETVLATVDDVFAKLDVERMEGQLAASEATLRNSRLDLERLSMLATSAAARQREVDQAEASVASGEATVRAIRAELEQANERLERSTIVAPFDGWVTAKHVEKGEWVESGTAIVEVISGGSIDAVLDVPEALVNAVGEGDAVTVRIDALGEAASGEVVSLVPDGSGGARTFPVEVRIDDLGGRLKAGMSATGEIEVGASRPRLTVPRDAVQFTASGTTVWVSGPIEGGGPFVGSAVPVPVAVETGIEDRFVVRALDVGEGSLLGDGAAVVTAGAEVLFPGRPLMVPGPPPAADAGSGSGEGS